MKKNTKTDRYQFLQKEEAWIIQALVAIEKTRSPDAEETRIIDSINRSLFINQADPFIDTLEKFLEMTVKYEIEDKPLGMTGMTATRWYTGIGDGGFFDLMKNGKDNFERRKKARQDKRIKAFEKTSADYDNFDDILAHAGLLREIQALQAENAELKARLAVVLDPSGIKPTEYFCNNPEQFTESSKISPSPRMMRIRQVMKERRKREASWLP